MTREDKNNGHEIHPFAQNLLFWLLVELNCIRSDFQSLLHSDESLQILSKNVSFAQWYTSSNVF